MELVIALASMLVLASADIYMHNPRGSNNRLDENGRERNNGNRMFDSQNNDRGGYNVGSLYYYEGSVLPIEWTNQHSCGGPNNHCELVIQYMCSEHLRDGATTSTIPDNPANCENYMCNTDYRYGMNENYDYYTDCKKRDRNQGLFTADQKLKGDAAIYTRQNPGGTRRGYECPEERDYYPYWHPTPWRDIAVMTNDVSKCTYYRQESENVKGRYHCIVPYMLKMTNVRNGQFQIPNNKEDCEAWRWPKNDPEGARAEWKLAPSHGIPPPKCQETQPSRDNHLGNGVDGYPNLFNWTIPAGAIAEKCAIRIRYNISTAEFDGWNGATNASLNQEGRNSATKLDLSKRYGLTEEEAENRGYVFEGNPNVAIFSNPKMKLQLAINTAQYGRTFQDRSHATTFRARPEGMDSSKIWNLNVRGKRGNIVQVYPGVEYDYVPNTLILSTGDHIHMQWTGSDTNPNNNDGQGRAGTDRSNVLLQGDAIYTEDSGNFYENTIKNGHWGRSYPAHLDESNLLGLSREDRLNLALLRPGQFRGELSELDEAGTYFDLGPRKITSKGTAHYMCSRNNNFSNRSQKGKIIVVDIPRSDGVIGRTGGEIMLPDQKAQLIVKEGALEGLTAISMESWSKEAGDQVVKDSGAELKLGSGYASEFVVINPQNRLTMDGQTVDVEMRVDGGNNIKVYRSQEGAFSNWQEVEASVEGGVARFQTSEGGVYVARKHVNTGAIVGAIFGIIVLIGLVVGTVIYFRKKPDAVESMQASMRKMKRGTQGAV